MPVTISPSRRSACLALCLTLAVGACTAGCASQDGGQTQAVPAAGQNASLEADEAVEVPGSFSEGGVRYLVTSEEGAQSPTVSVGTGTQPEQGVPGDGLADRTVTQLVIPATVEHEGVTYAVTEVAPFAFQCTGLTSVELPEGLLKIGKGAFQYCRDLQGVSVPSTVKLVGSLAFFANNSLAWVEFASDGSLKEIGDGAFAVMKTPGSTDNDDLRASLERVSLPASLNLLGSYAFYGQSSLVEVVFEGETIYSIAPGAFGYCTALPRIDLPTITSTIERIGRQAFAGDTALRVVTFRGGVAGTQTTQAGNEFSGCTGIEEVVYYDKRWNAANTGMNPVSGTAGAAFGGNFSFGTSGFADAPQAREYYTVYQYASLDDALAGAEPTGYAVVEAGTPLCDVVAGTCDFYEEKDFSTGGAWAFEDGASLGAGIADTLYCYPGSADDLACATVLLPGATAGDDGLPCLGTSALADGAPQVELRDPDGALLQEGCDYELAFADSDGAPVDPAAMEDGATYVVTASGAGAYEGTAALAFTVVDDAAVWLRLAADEPAATAKLACQATYANASVAEEPCDWAVLVGSGDLADAFTAAALAGALGAPVLPTDAAELSQQASYEVNRVGARKVVVLGDQDRVSQGAADAVDAMYVVDKSYRVSASSAAELAVQVLKLGPNLGASWSQTFVAVAAGDLASAATASPYCYANAAPLVWADEDGALGQAALDALEAAGMARAVVPGDARADAVAAQLEKAGYEVVRVAGDDDCAVNEAFAAFALGEGMGVDGAAVASPDALGACGAAGFLCGRANAVLLFADDAAAVLAGAERMPKTCYVLGTDEQLPKETVAQVRADVAAARGL